MGCFCARARVVKTTDRVAKETIEKELKVAALKDTLNLKLLILGSGESGKSTVLKQIKLINKMELTEEEIQTVISSLRRNAIQCIKILVEQAQIFGYEIQDSDDAKAYIEELDLDDLGELGSHTSDAVQDLWKNSAIKETYSRKSEFWILEAAEYFFNNIERFVDPEFRPTEEDIVMARVMTIGIIKTDFNYPPLLVTLVDVGGQRNERRKWMHCFDNVNGIIFLCNLAGYNTVLFEDATVNRMSECLALFKQTVNNPVFEKTPFYLLLNKKDMFEEKLRTTPLSVCECFSNYQGKEDSAEALAFVEKTFRSQIEKGDPNRLLVFSIAARFKRDVKTAWEDILVDLKGRNKVQINAAVKSLASN